MVKRKLRVLQVTLLECNGSSKTEICGSDSMMYFDGNTVVSAKSVTLTVCTTMSKSIRHAILYDTTHFLTADEITFNGCSSQVTKQ